MTKRLRFWAAMACVVLLAACGQHVALFNNMSERDANEVLAALDRAGIGAEKQPGKDGAVNLMVAQTDVARAVAHLDREGLPRERRASMGDVFRKEGLISSPLEERARYLWALSQELSETLAQIDGVLTARVHVVLPERSTGGEPGLPSSAAVFVKHRREVDLQPNLPELKRLVSSSIPGLSVEKVNVVLMPAASAPVDESAAKASKEAAEAQAQDEAALRQQRHLGIWGAVAAMALLLLAAAAWWLRRWWRAQAPVSAALPAAPVSPVNLPAIASE
ncbi:MAG: EscJ/YscJ/HrcJ family type III secretion inner membrane ring protein [Xanthomonadales bacterium]|uniref:type III secretion system inner membrane ring lipoprotein SctJ n=1 Tax=Hydrogenophaga sp. TaxID=1904254 RepID=UPI0016B61462|nr:type III secretion inner membrane ring lipoprotein SctJ [Hydrogenophaga sp.]NIQ36726.1 EscJ/YscJ/HrcJ family type III secretion inner membrane ring protein [Xanthomonadales bacterium]NIM41994.1 EscJ/YscJ/HrcJ family type III secretion inner membrane ring protein [Hydrogenophaga sp.]NIN27297.1 EscJ/YscJ/HrcJ family type III secretion inner membrane ring protein [Hydrogenophaga sp.]NIN31998.1 EscJ/YscJ/HrcJ family type III secretion inner membrane ring protein [Hydrogenophaga sp.]NIN56150.1 E